LAAVDSVTLVRGPFALTNPHNFSTDQHTRIIFFTTDLGFSQITQPDVNTLSVQIGGNSYPVEAVGPNSTLDGSFIVFRLPDLQVGTYPLSIRARGDTSINSPDLIIVASAANSMSASSLMDLLFPLPASVVQLRHEITDFCCINISYCFTSRYARAGPESDR
jgi:hypothetical protein